MKLCEDDIKEMKFIKMQNNDSIKNKNLNQNSNDNSNVNNCEKSKDEIKLRKFNDNLKLNQM